VAERPKNLCEHLRLVRERPAMYLGRADIEWLHRYVLGYLDALGIHGITEFGGPSFHQFTSWLKVRLGGSWTCGWSRGLLDRCGGNHAKALEEFFELAEEFGQLSMEQGPWIDLPAGHRRSEAWHRANGASHGHRPVPVRLQLMFLQPGAKVFLRSWYEDGLRDGWVEPSIAAVKRQVEWEYGIPATSWPRVRRRRGGTAASESSGGGDVCPEGPQVRGDRDPGAACHDAAEAPGDRNAPLRDGTHAVPAGAPPTVRGCERGGVPPDLPGADGAVSQPELPGSTRECEPRLTPRL
jgi:hypothetical protein